MIIGLSGSKGRMGQEILSILQERNIDTILNDVGDSKAEMFDKADAVIDFSSPSGLQECINEVKRTKKTLVSGTTPMTKEIFQDLQDVSKIAKVCWSANMSIGVAITKKISKLLGQYLPAEQYDCEILEYHHNKKKDAPSGTAMLLGQAVASGRNIELENNTIFNHNTGSARECGKIGFSSIRGGNIFGEHEVMFIGQNDIITIKHTAYNRRLFAVGAVEC